MFKTLLDLFEELFALKVTDPQARQELKLLRKEIEKNTETRNAFAHSRLLMPTKKREGAALRIKADDMSSTIHPVTLRELIAKVEAIDACEHQLSAFCDTHLPTGMVHCSTNFASDGLASTGHSSSAIRKRLQEWNAHGLSSKMLPCKIHHKRRITLGLSLMEPLTR